MIKWLASKLDVWLQNQAKNFDLDDENIDRVTVKDAWAYWRFINSPMFMLFNLVMIPFMVIMAPIIFLIELIEGIVYLVLIIAGVTFCSRLGSSSKATTPNTTRT